MSTKCSSEPSPAAFCPIPRCSRRSPAKRVRREEEEQGNERSFRRQAETEWSGLCDDEPPWAKSLAARRRRNPPARNETALSSSPHPSRLRRATFPYPLCRFATSPLDKGSRPPGGRLKKSRRRNPPHTTNPIRNLSPHPPQCEHWGTFPPRGRLKRVGGEIPHRKEQKQNGHCLSVQNRLYQTVR